MSEDFFIQLGSMITLFAINYLKYKSDIKQSEKKNESQHKKLFAGIDTIKHTLNDIITSKNYEKVLFDNITKKAYDKISMNTDLDSRIIRILNVTMQRIRSFSIKHAFSPYRMKRDDLEEYLKIESTSIFEEIDQLADDLFHAKEIKGKKISYSDYAVKYTDMKVIVAVMVKRLVDNGLNEDEYANLFKRFVSDLFTAQIKAWRMWTRI